MANVDIRRDIFQGNSMSQLLFVICIIPLTQILKKSKIRVFLEKWKKVEPSFVYG